MKDNPSPLPAPPAHRQPTRPSFRQTGTPVPRAHHGHVHPRHAMRPLLPPARPRFVLLRPDTASHPHHPSLSPPPFLRSLAVCRNKSSKRRCTLIVTAMRTVRLRAAAADELLPPHPTTLCFCLFPLLFFSFLFCLGSPPISLYTSTHAASRTSAPTRPPRRDRALFPLSLVPCRSISPPLRCRPP